MTYMPKELQKVVGTVPFGRTASTRSPERPISALTCDAGDAVGQGQAQPHAHARIMSINTEKRGPCPAQGRRHWEDFPPIPRRKRLSARGR